MTAQARRSARGALEAARPIVARLDQGRNGEDLAADLVDVWRTVESSLRTLVGSSALGGQALIREARQRQMIDFDLANALAEFDSVHSRLENTSYRPNDADVNAGKTAFSKLDAELAAAVTLSAPGASQGYGPPGAAAAGAAGAGAGAAPAAYAPTVPISSVSSVSSGPPVGAASSASPPIAATHRGMATWLKATIALVVVVVLGAGGYALFGRGASSSLDDGIDAYTHGQREVAVNDFNKAVRENPKSPMPHVYLARMARDVGNFSLASNELQLALEADPESPEALREMGANLLQQGNYELARRFYVRAVTANPTDKTAQGYLGCSLMRLGRTTEGQNFITRAGAGPWSSCTPAAPAPQVPPGTAIPR